MFSKLKELHPDKIDKLSEMKQHLLEMNNDMAPMKVGLGYTLLLLPQ